METKSALWNPAGSTCAYEATLQANLATLIAPSCQAGVDKLGQPRGGPVTEGNTLQLAADLGGPAAHGGGRGSSSGHDGDANAGTCS